ncbi:Aste57867_22225 [Aphanomyces stellatus]|uniref:Aste57867_22225 protein n=1 Tax=Aphanomyces stellatus TaxID=120398 RepID=A0A485LJT2_9STRA|nr:hypothetical protein As57867_022156 [Aphanomyces stellatus]VFT98892.1 Aste57867_22225 [Aphanomyces stellatus]
MYSFHNFLCSVTKTQLAGLPQSTLSLLAQNAIAGGSKHAAATTGPWKLSLDRPVYVAVMKHCTNASLRKQMFRANASKGSTPPHDNSATLVEILRLRQERALLLGFKSFAELTLADKMASSVSEVETLLADLKQRAMPKARAELVRLQEYATSHGHTGALQLWDVDFWSERMRVDEYNLDDEVVKEYFPLARVLAGMFELTLQLFGVQIEVADAGAMETWHPDVLVFNMHAMEQPGTPVIGHFYLDPFVRSDDKVPGSWMNIIACRSKVLRTTTASVRLPVFSISLNQTPPVDGANDSLMAFSDVEHLFHSFGYGLKAALVASDYTAASNWNGLEWDAMEIVSQFMENFIYHRPTVQLISSHVVTGASLPDALFHKCVAARTFMSANKLLRQLYLAHIDLSLHHDVDLTSNDAQHHAAAVFGVQARLAAEYCVLPPLPDDRYLCTFTHLFGGSYAASYYSYQWSGVLSADAFGAFEEASSISEWEAMGRKFRDTMLALMGPQHPMDVFAKFRGRPPTSDALLQLCGLD